MVSKLLIVLFLGGCFNQRPQGPEDVLRTFINYRLSSSQSKQELLDLSTGKMRAQIEAMPEENFKKFTNTSMFRLNSIEITLKSCNPNHCTITYVLKYSKMSGDTTSASNEIKKMAEIEKEGGQWKISGVSTVKTYLDIKDPINLR
jgi:hypothetical protein